MSSIKREILRAKENEFYYKNGRPYNGFYYIRNGIPYTYVQSGESEEILLNYNQITLFKIKDVIQYKGGFGTPRPIVPTPQEIDYANKFILRYFSQKRVTPVSTIIEIDDIQFGNATLGESDTAINLTIYNVISIEWRISGTKDLVRQANEKTIQLAELTFPGLNFFLRDTLQFFRPEIV